MEIYIVFIIGIIIDILIILGIYKWLSGRASLEIDSYKAIKFEQERQKYLKNLDDNYRDARMDYEAELMIVERKLDSINKEIEQKKEFNSSLLEIREKELDGLIEEKRKAKEAALDRDIEDWAASAQEAASWERDQQIKKYEDELHKYQESSEKYKEELQTIIDAIEDYRKKRETINQEILRARALEEKQDFYRIQLDNDSREDIQILTDINQRLNKTDLLNKLIYDNYIARPAKEMVKRVLEGKNPCGIYKVTNIETNEIYIGKSVKVYTVAYVY